MSVLKKIRQKSLDQLRYYLESTIKRSTELLATLPTEYESTESLDEDCQDELAIAEAASLAYDAAVLIEVGATAGRQSAESLKDAAWTSYWDCEAS